MKKIHILVLSVVIMFGFIVAVDAHQPRLVYPQRITSENPVIITQPDVSQAFYGELKGAPDYYRVTISEPMDFYFSLLVPDLPEIKKDISANLITIVTGEITNVLMGLENEWNKYYEEYAGDNYWQGPKQTVSLPKGSYRIEVFAPQNAGKYVLVVGQKESFPIGESLATLVNLPRLKMQFFGEKPLAFFNGKIGKAVGIILVVLVVLIVVVILAVKKIRNRKK
ncbi:MAG: hypothetical protein WC310_01825 [Patescibacteria group bacterium]|jgi:hypothetical protein